MPEREISMLRQLLDVTPVMMGVVELSDDGSDIIHVYDSPGMHRFFGVSARSDAGRSSRAMGVPEAVIARWIEHYRLSERLGREVRFEYEHPSEEGTRWLVSVVAPLGKAASGRTRFSYVTTDATETRRAQQRLADRETHLRLAMEASLSIAFEWDIVNDRVRRLQSSEEALPATEGTWDTFEGVAQVVHPDDRQTFRANVDRALAAADGVYRSKHRVVRPSGEVRWHAESGRVERDDRGRPVRLIGITQDVTEEHRREEDLRRQALLINVSQEPIFAWSDDGGIIEWNAGAERLYGFTRAEALGRRPHDLLRTVHPIPLDQLTSQLHQTGEWTGELRHRDKDGRELLVDSRQQIIAVDGVHVVLESNREITERRRFEDALRASEARFRRLFETNLLGIVFWDMQGGIHDANDEFLRIVGYDRHDLARGALNWAAMTPPEYKPVDNAAVEELLRTGSHAPFEKEYIRKDGSRIWVVLGAAALEANRGVAFVMDISVRKAAELALRQREEQALRERALAETDRALLDAVLGAAPAAIIVADAHGKLVRFNPANELLWGPAPRSETVDGYREWKGWWADDSPRRGRRLEAHEWAMARALQGETVRGDIVEIEPFDAPGVRRTMVNTGAPVRDGNGTIIGAVVAQMDISNLVAVREELRASEERFRSIAEALPGLVFVHGSDGRNTFVNQGFCQFAGRPPEGLLGDRWMELVHETDLAESAPRFAAAVAAAVPFEAEYRLQRHDGAWRWFLVRSVPQKAADGSVWRWMGSAIDITERRANEEMLREADRRKDEFIAILAHELRNPLAPVRTAVELLRLQGPADPRLERSRTVIERQVAHMARLIDDLLDVSRISRGKLALSLERCDLAAIARATAEDYRANLEGAGLEIIVRTSTEPLWVHGDPVRLAQMIANLLNNAGRFTERGGRVEVEAKSDQDSAVVTVTDTGVGIAPELLGRLFDPFSQAAQDLARTKGGLGLGLALTKGLAGLHGGTITAHSEGLGHGSTFALRIPLAARTDRTEAAAAHTAAAAQALRILVVEDNQDAAETLRDLLSLWGHDVKIAFDGPAAVAVAKEFRPKLVICDIGLPGELDGYGVARALRSTPETSGAFLMALSGYASSQARQLSAEAGFDAHFGKPADLANIRKTIAAVVER